MYLLTYLLTYAYSPAGGIGHRQQHTNGFGPGPVSKLGSNSSLYLDSLPLGSFSKCSWVYPSFSFPGGSWRVMDVGAFLRVRPIHFLFLLLISSSTSSCSVHCQSSLFVIFYGQWMWRIFLKQLLMNVWIFFVVVLVVLLVSEP